MTKHIRHHYMLSTVAVCIAFAGMLLFKNTTGNMVYGTSGGNIFKVFLSAVALLGLLIIFERGRNEH